MPEDALPSHPLDEVSYAELTTSRVEPAGLRPELDPSIREVLEALDDDAYAEGDEDDEDTFWDGVIAGGQVQDIDEQDWEDEEEEGRDVAEGVERLAIRDEAPEGDEPEGSWAAVKQFKATKAAAGQSDDDGSEDDDFASEGGDTIAELRSTLAKTKRPTRKASGSAAGSAFSMSSSAMYRNDGLRTLDDRFDQVRSAFTARQDHR